MATALDLQEQEQIDELKAFWARFGNLITTVLTVILLAYAGWNGWGWWQRSQGQKAAALYEAMDAAVTQKNLPRATQAFEDLKSRHPGALVTSQAALQAAALQADAGQADAARGTLQWLAAHAFDEGYAAMAQLRLAALAIGSKQWDVAAKALDAVKAGSFDALVADRRGDLAMAQGQVPAARDAWRKAWDQMPEQEAYRQVVEAKLTAAGAPPKAASATAPTAATSPAPTAATSSAPAATTSPAATAAPPAASPSAVASVPAASGAGAAVPASGAKP